MEDPDIEELDIVTTNCQPPEGSRGEMAKQFEKGNEPQFSGAGDDELSNFSPLSAPASNKLERWETLVEGDPAGDCYKAIERKDCVRIMEILVQDPIQSRALCCETGKENRTVLHVAGMQGCFRLAKQVIDLKKDKKMVHAKDGRSGLIAYWMADKIILNRSISEYIKCSFPGSSHPGRSNEPYCDYFFEAYPDTDWFRALAEGNTQMLRKLLLWKSRFLLETLYQEITVLHVAVWKDDRELVQMVVNAFGRNKKNSWGDSYFPTDLSWEEMIRARGWHKNLKNEKIHTFVESKNFKEGHHSLFEAISPLQLAEKLGRRQILEVLKKFEEGDMDFSKQAVCNPASNPAPEVEVLTHLNSFVSKYWDPAWNAEFDADIDYNFEDDPLRRSLLRFHYACKDPWKFDSYLRRVDKGIYDVHSLSGDFCEFQGRLHTMYDGQGRTPFHTLVDYYNYEKSPKWFFEKVYNSYQFGGDNFTYTKDARGCSPLIRAIIKNYLQNETLVSSHLVRFYKKLSQPRNLLKQYDSTKLMALRMAIMLKDIHASQRFLLEREHSYFEKNLLKINNHFL